jgi:hypothetical protein
MNDRAAYHQTYYEKNKEKIKARNYKWRADNKEKHDAMKADWRSRNKAREAEMTKRYREDHREECARFRRLNHLLRKYGLTREAYEAMLVSHDRKCAICRAEFTDNNRACVDHCHVSGTIRGLLCSQCNSSIAMAKDNPAVLRAAADYVEQRTPRSS